MNELAQLGTEAFSYEMELISDSVYHMTSVKSEFLFITIWKHGYHGNHRIYIFFLSEVDITFMVDKTTYWPNQKGDNCFIINTEMFAYAIGRMLTSHETHIASFVTLIS